MFISNKSTKFCQTTLYIKRFIHKRKVVPFSASRCSRSAAVSITTRTRCAIRTRRRVSLLLHSMRSRVYVTVVCPSVRLSRRSTAAAACGEFAAERRGGRKYRSTATPSSTGAEQQMWAVPR